MTSDAAILQVEGLQAGYGDVAVVRDVSFSIAPGSSLAVIGPNGVGKSTLLKAIIGDITAMAGTVTFAGTDLTRTSIRVRTRAGIAMVPEGAAIFGGLTVTENLRMGLYPLGRPAREVNETIDELLGDFPILAERANVRAATLSGGQRQLLALARSMLSRPKLLILDEPTAGLAPVVISELIELLRRFMATGVALLLSEQSSLVAREVATNLVTLTNGRISELQLDDLADESLMDRYLGRRVRRAEPPAP